MPCEDCRCSIPARSKDPRDSRDSPPHTAQPAPPDPQGLTGRVWEDGGLTGTSFSPVQAGGRPSLGEAPEGAL